MSKPLYACLCCAVDKDGSHYAPATSICHNCRTLDPNSAVVMARANWDIALRLQTETKAGRRAARRARLIAQYEREGGKRCTSCHAIKACSGYHNAFAICEPRGDGLQPECKACMKARTAILATPGASRATWHIVRDAMRAQSARQPAAGPASAGTVNAT